MISGAGRKTIEPTLRELPDSARPSASSNKTANSRSVRQEFVSGAGDGDRTHDPLDVLARERLKRAIERPSLLIRFWTPAKNDGRRSWHRFLLADNSIIVQDARPTAKLVVRESRAGQSAINTMHCLPNAHPASSAFFA